MTKLGPTDHVVRETPREYRGRPIIVELRSGVVVYRLKGTRKVWFLDHEVGIEAAMKVSAIEERREKYDKAKALL